MIRDTFLIWFGIIVGRIWVWVGDWLKKKPAGASLAAGMGVLTTVKAHPAFPAPNTLPHLTDRQLEALRLAATGLSNQGIGERMGVGEQTIKFHLSNAYAVLGVKNRTGAVNRARELGVL